MGPEILILVMVAVGAVLGLSLALRLKPHVPDQTKLAEWAKTAGVVVLLAERRWLLTGPFWYCRWPVVYRIRVRDAAGKEKDGWLCVEAPFYGINMEVRWS